MSSNNPIEAMGPRNSPHSEPAATLIDDDDARAPPRRRRRWSLPPRLASALLSSDRRLGKQIPFILWTAGLHLIWAFAYWLTFRQGGITEAASQAMLAVESVGIFGFYTVVRLGWSRHLADSALILPQMLWGSGSAALGFALAPALRPALLQVLCIIQMYGFFNLRPRQLAVVGGNAVVLLMAALAVGAAGWLPAFEVQREIYPAVLTIAVLIGMTAITMDYSARRGRLKAQTRKLNAAVAAVRDLAIRDTLTGLFNRRHMQDLLQKEQARALRTDRSFAVAMLDIDHFKRVNDVHGHATGDDVLRRFAELATRAMRQSDTIARWGGEEFLVLMPETVVELDARAPLERLYDELGQQDAGSLLTRLGVTFSTGIAFHRVSDSVEHSVACADRALYAAKAAGRNRLRVDTDTLGGVASPAT